MLFATFGCTHPPPAVLYFALKQKLSPKDIDGSYIMKLSLMMLIGTMDPKV